MIRAVCQSVGPVSYVFRSFLGYFNMIGKVSDLLAASGTHSRDTASQVLSQSPPCLHRDMSRLWPCDMLDIVPSDTEKSARPVGQASGGPDRMVDSSSDRWFERQQYCGDLVLDYSLDRT